MSQSRLTLMRHGLAENIMPDHGDFDRSLTPSGVREVTAMARWYLARDSRPELILASPAKRTHDTADIVCHQFGIALDEVCLVPEIYDASMETLLKIIRATDAQINHLFLVGHNPALDELSRYCVGRFNEKHTFSPGTIIEILLESSWRNLGSVPGTMACACSPRDLHASRA